VLLSTPRYDEFRDAMLALARRGGPVRLAEIAGNDEIFLTGVAGAGWALPDARGELVYALPLATDPARKRVAIRVAVRDLLPLLATLRADRGVLVDHIYDY
jgi:hypothetical protein